MQEIVAGVARIQCAGVIGRRQMRPIEADVDDAGKQRHGVRKRGIVAAKTEQRYGPASADLGVNVDREIDAGLQRGIDQEIEPKLALGTGCAEMPAVGELHGGGDLQNIGGLVVGGVEADIQRHGGVDIAGLEMHMSVEAGLEMAFGGAKEWNRIGRYEERDLAGGDGRDVYPEKLGLVEHERVAVVPDALVVGLERIHGL